MLALNCRPIDGVKADNSFPHIFICFTRTLEDGSKNNLLYNLYVELCTSIVKKC